MIKMTLYEVVQSHIKKFSNSLNTSMPALVTKVNYEGETISSVNARPVNNRLYSDTSLSTQIQDIDFIPLLFPSGGGAICSFPIKVGDSVLIQFSQGDIESFVYGGNKTGSPKTLRKFSLNDAIAIPCIYPISENLSPSKDHVELKYKDSVIRIKNDGDVEIEGVANVKVTSPSNVIIDSDNEVTINCPSVNIKSDKISIKNTTSELFKYLSDLTEEISKITVGDSPIDNLAIFTALKPLIDSFQE